MPRTLATFQRGLPVGVAIPRSVSRLANRYSVTPPPNTSRTAARPAPPRPARLAPRPPRRAAAGPPGSQTAPGSTAAACRPAAAPSQLIDQQHLVDVVAGQPVRRDHQDHVQVGQRGVVAQPVQARTAKAGAAVAVVTVDMLLIQDPATLTHRSTQPLKLLLDGLRLGLAAGGDPRIHPHAHQAPPVASAPPPGRRRAAPSPSAPAAGRPGPNGGRRRGGG